MKVVLIILSACCLAMPLAGEDQSRQKAAALPDSSIVPFVPFLRDSLEHDSLRAFIYPEFRRQFRQHMGIILVPDPYSIELNRGGILTADPTVDLGMIYPYRARQRLLLQKEGKLHQLPRRYQYYFPERHRGEQLEKNREKEK